MKIEFVGAASTPDVLAVLVSDGRVLAGAVPTDTLLTAAAE